MPLYLWRRKGPDGRAAGAYYIRGTAYRGGPGINESTGLADRALARLRLKERERELVQRGSLPAAQWVTFQEALAAFLEMNPPEKPGERRRLARLLDAFENTLVSAIGQASIDDACRRLLRPGAAPATRLREVITPMTSVLRFASRRGWCPAPDFERPRQGPGRTRWLTPAEFAALHQAAAPHLQPLLTFLACTGARLSEALELEWSAVDLGRARAVFHVTKGGRPRLAEMPPAAVAALAALPHREGRVFLHPHKWREGVMEPYRDTGRDGGGQIRTGFMAAVRRAGIARCTPHDLRHTWASWHYHLHRDPMKLQADGGWQSLAMVSRYAHLAMGDFTDGIRQAWGLPEREEQRRGVA
jgi:integrase